MGDMSAMAMDTGAHVSPSRSSNASPSRSASMANDRRLSSPPQSPSYAPSSTVFSRRPSKGRREDGLAKPREKLTVRERLKRQLAAEWDPPKRMKSPAEAASDGRLPAISQRQGHAINDPAGETILPMATNPLTSSKWSRKFGGRSNSDAMLTTAEKLAIKESRLDAFLERQLSHPAVEARRKLSERQKGFIGERQVDENCMFWGHDGRAGFRQYLITRYGSVISGWRHLDVDNSGRLSYTAFCRALRKMGYHGSLKTLWEDLDRNGTGFVSVMEIDREVGHTVGMFKLKLMQKYGDMLTAWQKGLDKSGIGHIEQQQVDACCQELGLQVNPERLWDMLRVSPLKTNCLHLKDFDPEAHIRWVTLKKKGNKLQGNSAIVEDASEVANGEVQLLGNSPTNMANSSGAKQSEHGHRPTLHGSKQLSLSASSPAAWRSRSLAVALEEQSFAILEAKQTAKAESNMELLEVLKKALVRRFGSLYGAWHRILDVEDNGRITFTEFCRALPNAGCFQGDVKGLWASLDVMHRGFILFGDLDPDTDSDLTDLRTKFEATYGNMLLAWLKGVDVEGKERVGLKSFRQACQKVGYTGDAKRLFKILLPESGVGYLTLKEFDIKAYNALTQGDFRMLSGAEPPHAGKSKLEMNINERTEASVQIQLAHARAEAKESGFAEACRLADPPERRPPGAEKFQDLCTRKYGSVAQAWRICLDKDNKGRLTFQEFIAALRMLGYEGNCMELWAQLDVDGIGYVSLRELDAASDEMLQDFLELIVTNFGDLHTAWKQGFHLDPARSVNLPKLRKFCKEFGFAGDPKQLFKFLQPFVGGQAFTLWDLQPLFFHKAKAVPTNEETKLEGKQTASVDWNSRSQLAGGSIMKAGSSVLSTQVSLEDCVVDTAALLYNMQQGLARQYGSTVTAWRLILDPHKKGFACRGNFKVALDTICFAGNIKALWQSLTRGADALQFVDLDPFAQQQLDDLRSKLLAKCGCIAKFWGGSRAKELGGKLSAENFQLSLGDLGLQVDDPKGVFKLFYMRMGQTLIDSEDFKGILVGVPVKDWETVWGYDTADGKRPPSPTLRQLIEQRREEFLSKDHRINTLDQFKHMLAHVFGGLFAAWRSLLDADQNGVVTYKDFTAACNHLGLWNIKEVWAQFDKRQHGQVYLEDLDEELASYFQEFERLLIDKFGHTKTGWRQTFEVEKTGLRCPKDKFIEGCKKLGYTKDASKLFAMLRPCHGRKYLYYEDVWENLNPNDFKLIKVPTQVDYKSPLGNQNRVPLSPGQGKGKGNETPASANASPSGNAVVRRGREEDPTVVAMRALLEDDVMDLQEAPEEEFEAQDDGAQDRAEAAETPQAAEAASNLEQGNAETQERPADFESSSEAQDEEQAGEKEEHRSAELETLLAGERSGLEHTPPGQEMASDEHSPAEAAHAHDEQDAEKIVVQDEAPDDDVVPSNEIFVEDEHDRGQAQDAEGRSAPPEVEQVRDVSQEEEGHSPPPDEEQDHGRAQEEEADSAPPASQLQAFLSRAGPEFNGMVEFVLNALGTDDVQEILEAVTERDDLEDLDAAGMDPGLVDKLFAFITASKQDDQGIHGNECDPPVGDADQWSGPPDLQVFLSKVGPEFDGMAEFVETALGTGDVEEILDLVNERDDLSDLDSAGMDSKLVDKLFEYISTQKQASIDLPTFLSRAGPEFRGMAEFVGEALGSDDVQEILELVNERDDLSDLDSAGMDAGMVDKLFGFILAQKQANDDDDDPL